MTTSIESMGILVIDDSLQMRRLLQSMLAEIGIDQIYMAKDGVEGMRFLGDCDEMVDVVLCDWKMPKMNGIDLLRQVRTVDPDLPFIMITGLSDEKSVLEAKSLGVSSYLVKPFSLAQVTKRLFAMQRLIEARKLIDA